MSRRRSSRNRKYRSEDQEARHSGLAKEKRGFKETKDRGCALCDECKRQDLPFKKIGGCFWALGRWGSDISSRPDQTGVIPWFMGQPCAPGAMLLYVRPNRPKAWKRGVSQRLVLAALAQGRDVHLDVGTERGYYAVP